MDLFQSGVVSKPSESVKPSAAQNTWTLNPIFCEGEKKPHQTVLKTYKTTKKTIKLQNNYINYKKLQ